MSTVWRIDVLAFWSVIILFRFVDLWYPADFESDAYWVFLLIAMFLDFYSVLFVNESADLFY